MIGMAGAALWRLVMGNIQWVALIVGVGAAAWWLYDAGVDRERARWEAQQAEKIAALEAGQAEAERQAERRRQEIEQLQAERDRIVEEFENALSDDGTTGSCLAPDELRRLNDTLGRIANTPPAFRD